MALVFGQIGCHAIADTWLVLDAATPSFDRQPVSLDLKFVGLVGDPIFVSDGLHSIRFNGEHRQELSMNVVIQGASVHIAAVGASDDRCGDQRVWSVTGWAPRVLRNADGSGFIHIVLPEPPYREVHDIARACDAISTQTAPHSLDVLVKTEPTGSEIDRYLEHRPIDFDRSLLHEHIGRRDAAPPLLSSAR
jgi:hypothetical protein